MAERANPETDVWADAAAAVSAAPMAGGRRRVRNDFIANLDRDFVMMSSPARFEQAVGDVIDDVTDTPRGETTRQRERRQDSDLEGVEGEALPPISPAWSDSEACHATAGFLPTPLTRAKSMIISSTVGRRWSCRPEIPRLYDAVTPAVGPSSFPTHLGGLGFRFVRSRRLLVLQKRRTQALSRIRKRAGLIFKPVNADSICRQRSFQ